MTIGMISCIFLTKYGIELKELNTITDFTERQYLTSMSRESRGFLLRLRGYLSGVKENYCLASQSYTALFLSRVEP